MRPSNIPIESLNTTPWVKSYFEGKTVVAIYLTHSQVDCRHKKPFGLEICRNFGPRKVEKVRQTLLAIGLPDIRDFHGSQKTEGEIREILDSKRRK